MMAAFTTHAEGKWHQAEVKRYVNLVIKQGIAPGDISISGIQNPSLEDWAKSKGVIFDKEQQFDVLHPEEVA